MTDCGCDKAKEELEEFLHRELSDENFRDVADHLDNCEDCTNEHVVGVTLMQRVRTACQEKAPDELRMQILEVLDGTSV